MYSYFLCKAIGEENVVAICRSHYDAAAENGFTINSNLHGKLVCRPQIVRSVTEALDINPSRPYTHIIVTSKALPSTPSVPTLLAPAVHPTTTTLVLIQNGISIEAPYSTAFPDNTLLSCVAYLPITQTAPAVFSHYEVEHLLLGTFPYDAVQPHKATADTFTSLLEKGGAKVTHVPDIQGERWKKLIVNGSWNPICALTRCRDAQLMHSSPGAAGYVEAVMNEIADLATVEGHGDVAGRDAVQFQMGRAKKRQLPGIEPSMMADVGWGKELECDALVGNAVRLAEKRGVEVPLLRGLEVMIKGLSGSLVRDRKDGKEDGGH